MKYGELNLGQIEAIVNKLGGMAGVQRFLAGECTVAPKEPPTLPKPRIERTFKLTLDYSMAPADMLRATKCDYIYQWMLEHCPGLKGTGRVEVTANLIDMGGYWTRNESLAAIDALGLVRTPDNAALWTLSKDHPDLQCEIWVVDPETVWQDENGNPCVTCLGGRPGERSARLDRVESRWVRRNLVLALSK